MPPVVIPFMTAFGSGFLASFGAVSSVFVGAGGSLAGVAAAGTAFGNFMIQAGISVGLSAIAGKAMAPSVPDMASPLEPGTDPAPAKKFIYGRTRVAGDIVYLNTSKEYTYRKYSPLPFASTFKSDSIRDKLLHMVIELAGHPIHSIHSTYIDDDVVNLVNVTKTSSKKIWPGKNTTDDRGIVRRKPSISSPYEKYLMFKFYPQGSNFADKDLLDAAPFMDDDARYTPDMIGSNKAHVYARIGYEPEIISGYPNFSFLVSGKK
jgi:hypothetical protein